MDGILTHILIQLLKYIQCTFSPWLFSFYDELLSNGILQPLTEKLEGTLGPPDTQHYVAPAGISSLVKFYLNKSGEWLV